MPHRILSVLIIIFLSACGGGGGGNNNTPNPPPASDTTAPVITVTGSASVNHEQGTTYVDAGATATDDVDGTVNVTTTGTVGDTAGTYTLTYTATDAAGNSATATREVIVADTTPPAITVTGGTTTNHEQGTVYTDAGATATDVVDGTVDVTATGTVGATAGDYTITYSATDAAGNSASADRIVTVADTTPPVVTLLGVSLVVLTEGDAYTEAGASATDLVDGVVAITTSGTVDTNTVADYVLTYSATDAAGNTGTATRTVRVEAIAGSDDIIVLSQGVPGSEWDLGLNAFDIGASGDCSNDGGAGCPNMAWSVVQDPDRGNVLEISHSSAAVLAGFYIKSSNRVDLTAYRNGALLFDLKTVTGDGRYTMKIDCEFPCSSGEQIINFVVDSTWNAIIIPLLELEQAGLVLSNVDTGIVIWASDFTDDSFRIDNARFVKSYTGDSSIGGTPPPPNFNYNITAYGKGSISDTINPSSYKCGFDFINYIYNAGVVVDRIGSCDVATQTPGEAPTPLLPQVTGDAASKPLATHRWWGSLSYLGEMTIGDVNSSAYITPDPIIARVSNAGIRMMGIPNGIRNVARDYRYDIPAPFDEVFDGIAVANSAYNNMEGYTQTTSDGSVTVEWQSGGVAVMTATFVHGSPYVFVEVLDGELQIKTLRTDGGEKGIYYEGTDSLGVWTSVAGNTNYFLVTGDGATSFSNINGDQIGVSNASKSYTITFMPSATEPSTTMIADFEQYARNVIDTVQIDYVINPTTQAVAITQQYLDSGGAPVTTMAGLLPLHWKNTTSTMNDSGYKIRSARGITKFMTQSSFTYEIPHVGLLPTLPTFTADLDVPKLTQLINDFIAQGQAEWLRNDQGVMTDNADTYWSGKAYNQVAELIAIADALGLTTQKQQLFDWLKAELEDWFTAETNGELDVNKYFVYDDTWDTLLGLDESFRSHQLLNDHHFHYGYFVRAAAEICRHEASWCSASNYGPMIELLIRDYAGGRNDPMFPYLRHFDPANGFSWASGSVNFVRGNNNESTSEAANAYGAMVLFGLITGNQDLIERGTYLHASTSAAYWEYWNNIGGYTAPDTDADNFLPGYNYLATSIIWGDGVAFETFFSGATSFILGIQGLPSNPLTLHIGIYSDYLVDFVNLGVSEGNNGKPSGLIANNQWPDIWWNILALTDANASIADYNSVTTYNKEIGESKAHTYHWINTFKVLGQMAMGTGALTADYPAAMAFNNNGVITYVVYNYGSSALTVTYSDGTIVTAAANQFTVVQQ